MKCKKCKENIDDSFAFCPHCGFKLNNPYYTQKSKSRGNGTGTVYQLPNKKWRATVTLGYYTDENGKKCRNTRSRSDFKTKKEALEYIPKLKYENVEKLSNITFKELYEKWFDVHESKVTKSTMDCYKAAYKYYDDIKYYKMVNIKTEQLQHCIDTCGQGKRTMQNMRTLGTLLFSYAMQNDIVNKNYASFIYIPKLETTTRIPFTQKQIDLLFKSAKTDDNAKYVLCMIYTGFRLGEFIDIHVDHYNAKEHYVVGGKKTAAGKNRTVTISPKIQPYVDEFAKHGGYLFTPKGRKTTEKYFRSNIFYPALVTAGIIPENEENHTLTPHCTRHTFATLMKNVNAPATDKQKLIGHSKFEMTAYYTHTDVDSLKTITDFL